MSAKKFYEQMRQAGLTEDITSNDSPDYNLPFYQSIFRLMEEFSKKEYEEKLRWIPTEEKLPDYVDDFSLNIEMKLDNGLILTGYKFKNTNEWFHYDYNHVGHLIQGARFVTHWRYFL